MTLPPLIATLTSRALISVSGPDWRSFLQGLITQDVETLKAGELRFGALLTPQGKLLFDLFFFGRDEGCLIDVAADRREALVQRLMLYRLRAKVEIKSEAGAVLAAWQAPCPHGEGWAEDPRLHLLGARGYGAEPPHGAIMTDEDAYHAHRLAQGVPDPDRDCPPETAYPIEADFDLLNGIDFKKGCFVGQETTSRMKRRGAIKNRMLSIRFDGPAPAAGSEVLAGSLRAGQVLSGREGMAMALLRLDRIEGAQLTVDGWPVQVMRPGWMGEN